MWNSVSRLKFLGNEGNQDRLEDRRVALAICTVGLLGVCKTSGISKPITSLSLFGLDGSLQCSLAVCISQSSLEKHIYYEELAHRQLWRLRKSHNMPFASWRPREYFVILVKGLKCTSSECEAGKTNASVHQPCRERGIHSSFILLACLGPHWIGLCSPLLERAMTQSTNSNAQSTIQILMSSENILTESRNNV